MSRQATTAADLAESHLQQCQAIDIPSIAIERKFRESSGRCGRTVGAILVRLAGLISAGFVVAAGFQPIASDAKTLSLKEIREEGVVIQKWDTSCGAAALATVFTYTFNDPVTEREVASGLLRQTEPLQVRHRGGFNLLDMKRYAAERGYRAIGFRDMSFEDIRYMDAPIIPVQIHGYNHYVVYKGLTPDGNVHVADPAYGNRTLSRQKFDEAWIDGIAFVILRGTE